MQSEKKMRSYITCLLMSVVGLAGIALACEIVFFDIPIYIGRLSADYLDPVRAAHSQVPPVSAAELIVKQLLVVACLVYVASGSRWAKSRRGFSKREAPSGV